MKASILRIMLVALLFICASIGLSVSAYAGPFLQMASVEVDDMAAVKQIARMGIDIAAVRKIVDPQDPAKVRYRVEIVVSKRDEQKLERQGLKWQTVYNLKALESESQLKAKSETMYHSFDESGSGIQDQLIEIEKKFPKIASLETIGYSVQQRPLLAMCLSSNWVRQHGRPHRGQPEVLFLATHHAREWVATYMAMQLISYLTTNYGNDDRVTQLLDTTQVWIIPVANPDGYQYTFDVERLWRKNLRDNDGDGQITLADGVDLNRNFDSHWGLDDEGSSPAMYDATYRGDAPNSEPENQAVVDFIQDHNFKSILSYHTYSNLILYPWGWQVKTQSQDDPIFVAQAGTDDEPAIWDNLIGQGYNPGLSADLYPTNGDFTDWSYAEMGIPSYTVELTLGEDIDGNPYGFIFPDDEAMLNTVFEDNLEFALCLAESAADPAHPKSPVGIEVESVYHDPLASSHGSRQMIDAMVSNRKVEHAWLLYCINKTRYGMARLTPAPGKDYNNEPGVFYTRCQAWIEGQQTGDEVTYWLMSPGSFLGPYSYSVTEASDHRVLVVSAEDYTGENPVYADQNGPNYLDYYTQALDSIREPYDVWDVTAANEAPTYREVLSNYDTVIWYTGDDFAAEVPDLGVTESLVLGLRDFMNYSDGKLLASGQDMMSPAAVYGLLSDDFFQYKLGAYLMVDSGGIDPVGKIPYDVEGESGDPVFDGLTFSLNGADSADNQAFSDTFLTTSSFLPHFDTTLAARYVRPGGPFEPHTGEYYVYSQMANQAYKRLGGTFTLAETDPQLTFWISYDIETDWDFAFVEIRTAGQDDWTTLPDINGLTTTSTGQSCLSGWADSETGLHPHLAHYMDSECTPTGTTGQWNSFTGNSNGWQQVAFDLSAYAGQTVEIHIAYVSDWSTQNLGVFVDDVQINGEPAEGFETGLGNFEVSAAEGNLPLNNWNRAPGGSFTEGPIIRTPDSIFMGFGFEAISGSDQRADVMQRALDYLNPAD